MIAYVEVVAGRRHLVEVVELGERVVSTLIAVRLVDAAGVVEHVSSVANDEGGVGERQQCHKRDVHESVEVTEGVDGDGGAEEREHHEQADHPREDDDELEVLGDGADEPDAEDEVEKEVGDPAVVWRWDLVDAEDGAHRQAEEDDDHRRQHVLHQVAADAVRHRLSSSKGSSLSGSDVAINHATSRTGPSARHEPLLLFAADTPTHTLHLPTH